MRENKFNAFFGWVLLTTVFLLPLFFWPQLTSPLINSKLLILLFFTLIGGLFFIGKSVHKQAFELIKSPFVIPLLVFGLIVLISSLANYQYPLKQLMGMGGAYLSLVGVVLLAPSLIEEKTSKLFAKTINLSVAALGLLSILQAFGFGIGPLIGRLSHLEIPNSLAFSPSGAAFISIQLFTVVLLGNFFDHKKLFSSFLLKVTSLIILIALVLNLRAVLPGGEARFQSLSLSDSVALVTNSMTFTKSALLGYGPESYGNAYNILKPIWINGSDYWRFTFDSGFNLPLTMAVSLGLIGTIAYLFFMLQLGISLKKSSGSVFLRSFLAGILLWQLFSPVNPLMWGLLAIATSLLVFDQQNEYKKIKFSVHQLGDLLNHNKWVQSRKYLFWGTTITALILLTAAVFTTGKVALAYHWLHRGSVSISQNDAYAAYEHHQQAKNLAPELDFIRRNSAALNLQLAVALSNKADISSVEQEQVLQLVNQAIREARAAVILDPANYQNWLMLAQIYLQLIDTTDQAFQEAFNALAKAVAVNPNNPEIRLMLGELFFKTGKNQDAAVFFGQAVERKANLAIAHYYLARALEANEQLNEARAAYTSFLLLTDKESADYKAVEDELNALLQRIESAGSNISPAEVATSSAVLESNLDSNESILSDLLDSQAAETIIQEGALSSDQDLIQN